MRSTINNILSYIVAIIIVGGGIALCDFALWAICVAVLSLA